MQLIELELDHDNFYCPVTGSKILSEDSFDSCPSLQGVWTNHAEEPETLKGELKKLWEAHLDSLDKDDFQGVPEFLKGVDNSDYVAFAIYNRRDGLWAGEFHCLAGNRHELYG